MTPIERAAEVLPPFPGPSDIAVARAAFESIDVDEMARALRRRAAYEGVVITDRQAQRIARDLRTYLLTDGPDQ